MSVLFLLHLSSSPRKRFVIYCMQHLSRTFFLESMSKVRAMNSIHCLATTLKHCEGIPLIYSGTCHRVGNVRQLVNSQVMHWKQKKRVGVEILAALEKQLSKWWNSFSGVTADPHNLRLLWLIYLHARERAYVKTRVNIHNTKNLPEMMRNNNKSARILNCLCTIWKKLLMMR